ncbi:serine/threonine-protein kinase, partial [Streptomyces smaragdinus]|uniref:serine/threonine-protein kinase n=1 Tax=Streptomyces smaragdinus TaxID=2585196 RepID=UPI002B1F3C43
MNGRVIAGRYELASLVGQGGMGQVWQGYDHTLERRVAVKLLHSGSADGSQAGDLRRRFLRECRVTARIGHPGLVTVYDAGSDGDELYLVMEYVEGADLADHLAEHEPYPCDWTAAVAAQLCSVLAAVHAVPVVHRDLKPRNVMIRPEGNLTVLDLGIAAVLDIDTTRLTRTGVPVGSPAYMAPEQAMGGAVGPYTDLYALGVVLYELLTGEVPFADTTALGVLHAHLYKPPAPVRDLRALAGDGDAIPIDLDVLQLDARREVVDLPLVVDAFAEVVRKA